MVKAKGESFPLSSCALSSGDKFVFMCCSFTFVEGLTGDGGAVRGLRGLEGAVTCWGFMGWRRWRSGVSRS